MKLIDSQNTILDLLFEFDDVFPHNRDKVADYAEWAKKIYSFGYGLVEYQGENAIGFVAFYANDLDYGIGFISLFGIKHDYRKKGLGKYILHETLSFMKEKGMSKCRLEVDKDNENAIAFYKRNGFGVINENENTYLLELEI